MSIDKNALFTLTPVTLVLHFADFARCLSNSMTPAGVMTFTG
jgi:hypothetical protein